MSEEQVEDAWAPSGPLVSDPMSALCLRAEYAGNPNENFMAGIDALHRRYDALRRVRGDGNCFFRGFIFALCEQLLTPAGASASASANASAGAGAARLRARVEDTIRASKAELLAVGYSDVAIDAFWETFVDYLAAMETRSLPELVQDFQTEGGESEYLVWYARLLTAGHMKKHADQFQPFIEGLFPGLTVAQFCAAEVEPMGKECDQPQIQALAEALGVGVKIECLDGTATDLQAYVCLPSGVASASAATNVNARAGDASPLLWAPESAPSTDAPELLLLHLLYRPGHYDILYPRTSGAAPSPTAATASTAPVASQR